MRSAMLPCFNVTATSGNAVAAVLRWIGGAQNVRSWGEKRACQSWMNEQMNGRMNGRMNEWIPFLTFLTLWLAALPQFANCDTSVPCSNIRFLLIRITRIHVRNSAKRTRHVAACFREANAVWCSQVRRDREKPAVVRPDDYKTRQTSDRAAAVDVTSRRGRDLPGTSWQIPLQSPHVRLRTGLGGPEGRRGHSRRVHGNRGIRRASGRHRGVQHCRPQNSKAAIQERQGLQPPAASSRATQTAQERCGRTPSSYRRVHHSGRYSLVLYPDLGHRTLPSISGRCWGTFNSVYDHQRHFYVQRCLEPFYILNS